MNYSYLLKYAVNYLSKFSSSKKNLERVLKLKIQRLTTDKRLRFELYSEVHKILKKLEDQKLINDTDYIENKINLFVSQKKSKKFIENYLIKKGVEQIDIHKKLEEFENNNYDWEKKSAFAFAKKKKLLESSDSFEKKLGKMARAGFPYEICKEILK
tara:strand:+ start:186 stop:656 length:471 start_codon:yes stop_codon:yes gene_type:complete